MMETQDSISISSVARMRNAGRDRFDDNQSISEHDTITSTDISQVTSVAERKHT